MGLSLASWRLSAAMAVTTEAGDDGDLAVESV
jgi:hypothetical protein